MDKVIQIKITVSKNRFNNHRHSKSQSSNPIYLPNVPNRIKSPSKKRWCMPTLNLIQNFQNNKSIEYFNNNDMSIGNYDDNSKSNSKYKQLLIDKFMITKDIRYRKVFYISKHHKLKHNTSNAQLLSNMHKNQTKESYRNKINEFPILDSINIFDKMLDLRKKKLNRNKTQISSPDVNCKLASLDRKSVV